MRCATFSAVAIAIACFSVTELYAEHRSGHHSRQHSHETHAKNANASHASARESLQKLSRQNEDYIQTFNSLQNTHERLNDAHTRLKSAIADPDSMSDDDRQEIMIEINQEVSEIQAAIQIMSAQIETVKKTIEAIRHQ